MGDQSHLLPMPEDLKPLVGRGVGTGGRHVDGPRHHQRHEVPRVGVVPELEGDALGAVVDASTVGADEVTDLMFVNMKGPDYTAHAKSPEAPELTATLAELDRQVARLLALWTRRRARDGA